MSGPRPLRDVADDVGEFGVGCLVAFVFLVVLVAAAWAVWQMAHWVW